MHDVDRSISAKKNRMERNKKVDDICSFVIIKIKSDRVRQEYSALTL